LSPEDAIHSRRTRTLRTRRIIRVRSVILHPTVNFSCQEITRPSCAHLLIHRLLSDWPIVWRRMRQEEPGRFLARKVWVFYKVLTVAEIKQETLNQFSYKEPYNLIQNKYIAGAISKSLIASNYSLQQITPSSRQTRLE
jgi:hypothetical protein